MGLTMTWIENPVTYITRKFSPREVANALVWTRLQKKFTKMSRSRMKEYKLEQLLGMIPRCDLETLIQELENPKPPHMMPHKPKVKVEILNQPL